MFFGKSKPEEVKPDALYGLLNSLFEKKLGIFSTKAQKITEELQKNCGSLTKACDDFEKLDAEPHVENIYFTNVSSIKSQKHPYLMTLERIISGTSFEAAKAQNSYERYKLILSNVQSMTNEILKTNANFKLVLYSYASHMGIFKQSFSGIEKSTEALRREIEGRSSEASEFNSLSDWISKLSMQLEAKETINGIIDRLKESMTSTKKETVEKEEADLLKGLAEKKTGLSTTEKEIESLSTKISTLTNSLERPAGKMDHLSMRKKQLRPLLIDPINTIRNEAEYAEFRASVKELKENVEKGSVDTKNKEGTLNSISLLLDADLYGMMHSLKSLQGKRSEIDYEVKIFETALSDVREGRMASEKAVQDIASIGQKLEETRKSITSAKQTLEKMFSDYYRKQITIIL
jgi:chromosome segregation ATPase